MNRLVQQPAGDPGARKHYRDTIENPVNLESISEFLDPFVVPVVASVAAGDAFNGGLGVGLASGMELLDAALLGMASGAICVSRDGAQEAMGSKTEVLALMALKTQ